MPYTITSASGPTKQASVPITGGMGGTRTITSATAAFVTNNVMPNDRLVITGSASGDGTYLVDFVLDNMNVIVRTAVPGVAGGSLTVAEGRHTLVISGEDVVTLAAASAAQPQFIRRKVVDKVNEKQPATLVTQIIAPDRIIANAAAFSGNGTRVGHSCQLSGTAFNDNANLRIAQVVSPTELRIEQGNADPEGSNPPLINESGFGTVRTFRQPWVLYECDVIAVQFNTTATAATAMRWFSWRENAVWGRGTYPTSVTFTRTAGTKNVVIYLGRKRPGLGRSNAELGSCWIGAELLAATNLGIATYGSFVGVDGRFSPGNAAGHPNDPITVADPGDVSATFMDVKGPVNVPGTDLINTVMSSDDRHYTLPGAPLSAFNVLLIGSQTASLSLLATATLDNFDMGTITVRPAFTMLASQITIRDARQDFSLSDLFNVFTTSVGTISYTWNPRFVARNENTKTKVPVQGLTVEIFEINETTLVETLLGTFTSDANGRINSGAGRVMRRATRTDPGPVDVEYTHRVRISGNGYLPQEQLVKPTHHVQTDWPVMVARAGYLEGEAS